MPRVPVSSPQPLVQRDWVNLPLPGVDEDVIQPVMRRGFTKLPSKPVTPVTPTASVAWCDQVQVIDFPETVPSIGPLPFGPVQVPPSCEPFWMKWQVGVAWE
jgi:hypothetical protein